MYITIVKEDEEGQYIEIPQEYWVDGDTLMIHRVGSCLYLFPRSYPSHHISLRRIRDLDGHLVTREEFFARKR